MSSRSKLHIVIPGICGPLAEVLSIKNNKTVNDWLCVLSKASQSTAPADIHSVISSIFSIQAKNDFPSAELNLLTNEQYDSNRFYMHADPVHLRADLDSAVLSSSKDLAITDEEAALLCELLNQHFVQDGLSFFSFNKDQWFVSCKDSVQLQTTPLSEAVGRNINFILPEGKDSSLWTQRLTEAQMLLHSHEINQKREDAGLMSINSLWFHGSGNLSDMNVKPQNINGICSNQAMLKGLAEFTKCSHIEMPESVNGYIEHLLSCSQGSENVLYLQDIDYLTNYTDTRPWLSKLEQVLDNWVYPLLKSANKNNIQVILYPCDGKQYQFSRFDYLKLWRKPILWQKRRLENYISCYTA